MFKISSQLKYKTALCDEMLSFRRNNCQVKTSGSPAEGPNLQFRAADTGTPAPPMAIGRILGI